ncbi:MAG TPA: TAXI family TRAP transporter solute-binding subunit [Hyphomicrobiaceae bacterium]|jgi:TRAP-type uncharacterized transport system substrate-binding protein|nr:TAXI family TRAP transporter solute-binding subunit [Hyphomicrobiaceae bacterium]
MQLCRVLIVAVGVVASLAGSAGFAQDTQKAARDKLNEGTVFIAGGTTGATYHALANDISLVLSDENLRVVAVSSSNAVQNVRDLVYLRSIDTVLTNTWSLNNLLTSGELGPDLKRQIHYIAPLTTEEAHVLARPEINSLQDLKGKKVGFHTLGGSSSALAKQIFQILGIDVQAYNFPQPEAVAKMRQRELDATICVCPKVLPAYANLKPEEGFRFLEVPYMPAMEAQFLPSKIADDDYPNLVAKDSKVNTVAIYTVLVTLNWPKGSMRYNRNAKFVDALFSKYENFLKPPWQKSWKNVNFAAKVSGWQRFAAAQEWLDRREREASKARTSFDKFLDDKSKPGRGISPAERERLFREFQEWSRRPAR